MDFHLERALRLSTQPQHKNLYSWAINELNDEGRPTGGDQIPWWWSLYFTATSCILRDHAENRHSLPFKFRVTSPDGGISERESGGKKEQVERGQFIRMTLRPGFPRPDGGYERQTSYSMFGTDRTIQKFELCIYPSAVSGSPEEITAWGSPSYTSEIDFREETTDDCLVFNLSVTPDAFARYAEKIDYRLVDEIVLRIGYVDGFYSAWSPSISTDRVKVLTSYPEQILALPSDHQHEPPRLGKVGEFALSFDRRLKMVDETSTERPEALTTEPKPTLEAPQSQVITEQQTLQVLQSLKRAAWFSAWALGLLFLLVLFRR